MVIFHSYVPDGNCFSHMKSPFPASHVPRARMGRWAGRWAPTVPAERVEVESEPTPPHKRKAGNIGNPQE